MVHIYTADYQNFTPQLKSKFAIVDVMKERFAELSCELSMFIYKK